jgi:O-antigen/teichoic acid export membrane protein
MNRQVLVAKEKTDTRSNTPGLKGPALLSLLLQVVRSGGAIISVPILLQSVGPTSYGLWMTAVGITSFLSVIDATFVPAIKNKLALAHARGDEQSFTMNLSCAVVFGYILLGLGVFSVPAVWFAPWSVIFNVTALAIGQEARSVMVALVLANIVALAISWVDAVHAARMDWGFMLGTNLALTLVSVPTQIILAKNGSPLWLLAVLPITPVLITRLLFMVLLMQAGLRTHSEPLPVILKMIREIMPSSLGFALSQSMAVVVSTAPTLVIAHVLGPSQVGALTLAQQLCSPPLVVLGALMPIFWPTFTTAGESKHSADFAYTFRRYLLATIIGVLLYCGVLCLAGISYVVQWLNGNVAVDVNLLIGISAWTLTQALMTWHNTLLNSRDVVYGQALLYAIQIALLLPLSVKGAQLMGLPGVALAMTFAALLGGLLPRWYRVNSMLMAPPRSPRC